MALKNVFMEPLKKVQVEGYVMFAEPEVLFGNLDELCCVSWSIIVIIQTLKLNMQILHSYSKVIIYWKQLFLPFNDFLLLYCVQVTYAFCKEFASLLTSQVGNE